jgi:hypothetical protein
MKRIRGGDVTRRADGCNVPVAFPSIFRMMNGASGLIGCIHARLATVSFLVHHHFFVWFENTKLASVSRAEKILLRSDCDNNHGSR